MSVTDPIADMLTRIRNALLARKETVEVPRSGVCEEIIKVMRNEGYIKDYKSITDNKQGRLKLYLRGKKALTGIRRISRPGRRAYVKSDKVPRVLGGIGMAVISTSSGILTDKDSREKRLGGEVICYIW